MKRTLGISLLFFVLWLLPACSASPSTLASPASDPVPINQTAEGNNSFVKVYHGMKWPATSGVRRYIGKEPLRIYPDAKAPFVYENYKPQVVELINEVQGIVSAEEYKAGNFKEPGTWCLVLDSYGVSGYAQRSDLVPLKPEDEEYARDFGHGLETLGGFKVGDRVETLIGRLDRDYYLIYENGRIYEFPDSKYDRSVDPMDRFSAGWGSLDAFVWYDNHVTLLRTDSPEFKLKDGSKVGDNAAKLLKQYESKYKYFTGDPTHYQYSKYTFEIEEGHHLQFYIDTEELTPSSVIKSICIN